MTPTPVLKDWQCQIGDLLVGDGTPYEIASIGGINELPDIRTTDISRPAAHGEFQGSDYASGRTFTLSLEITAMVGISYVDALAALRAVMVPTGPNLVPFWFKIPGRQQMYSAVKVRRYRIPADTAYTMGFAVAEVQLHALDPILYGTVLTVSTGFPVSGGGLLYPLYTNRATRPGILSFGARSTSGRMVVTNPGNAAMWPQWQISGPVPSEGFEIIRVGTGERLRFEGAVPSGSTLVLDSATGVVLIDGYADRSGLLTWRDWSSIAAGASAEFAFTLLGSFSAAQLTASCTPGWW